MTNCHSTASHADHGNFTYPTLVSDRDNWHVAEDKKKYAAPPHLSSKDLKAYFDERLEEQREEMPNRVHMLFEDLMPLLQKHKRVDVFDLLVELILLADYDPAQCLTALLAVLDDDALIDLESGAIKRSGEFISDSLKRDVVRWHLEEYRDRQKDKRKESKKD